MKKIENGTFDEERAFYGTHDVIVKKCSFDGPADGESAFKECENISVENCFFNLRYPFWHDHHLKIVDSEMTELCRAALWYSDHVEIADTNLHGIKALRECSDIMIKNCDIISPEFGWSAQKYSHGKYYCCQRIFYDAFRTSYLFQCEFYWKIFFSVCQKRCL